MKNDINIEYGFLVLVVLINDDVIFEYKDMFLRIPQVTPSVHIEP